ncbi:unnamed protein product [Urochloa humidicola]
MDADPEKEAPQREAQQKAHMQLTDGDAGQEAEQVEPRAFLVGDPANSSHHPQEKHQHLYWPLERRRRSRRHLRSRQTKLRRQHNRRQANASSAARQRQRAHPRPRQAPT